MEYCHLTTEPVLPLKVSVSALVPVHTVEAPEIVPATLAVLTVTVTTDEYNAAQGLF